MTRITPNTCRVYLERLKVQDSTAADLRIEYTPKPAKTALMRGNETIIAGKSRDVAEYLYNLVGPVTLG